ncbi:hypothetical protein ANN_25617 [Periplaneta americana]|uniref:Uncharacterized protein n=1 Tax=Periplaneta americana TaxID=6978 RepID=A0ABQ8S1G5_PERAM|nr:hypothetical protein ANN_25617 [Periplaneta americana]
MAGLCEGGNEPSGSLKAIAEQQEWSRARAQCSGELQLSHVENLQQVEPPSCSTNLGSRMQLTAAVKYS